jgi:hypothetical protein
MPVEIKELVIRAVAKQEGADLTPAAPASRSDEERQAIVEAAVKEVLRVLKASRER